MEPLTRDELLRQRDLVLRQLDWIEQKLALVANAQRRHPSEPSTPVHPSDEAAPSAGTSEEAKHPSAAPSVERGPAVSPDAPALSLTEAPESPKAAVEASAVEASEWAEQIFRENQSSQADLKKGCWLLIIAAAAIPVFLIFGLPYLLRWIASWAG